MMEGPPTANQIKAARSLLGWEQSDLAREARVRRQTVISVEKGQHRPQRRTTDALRAALEAAGVVFTNGDEPGVKLRREGGEP